MRSPIALVSASIALLAATFPGLAAATPNFPQALRDELGLSYTPVCTICHEGTPGIGTATTKFAVAMQQRGLAANDAASLTAALQAMETDAVDSDGDGTIDVKQLEQGRDPSSGEQIGPGGDGGVEAPPTIAYGCGAKAQIGAGEVAWEGAFALLTVLGLGLGLARRRR